MVPIEDLTDVTLAIEDTDEDEEDKEDEDDEEDEGGPGWFALASMCKPSTSLGRREEKWGEEDLNFRSFLGSLYRSRSISIGSFS